MVDSWEIKDFPLGFQFNGGAGGNEAESDKKFVEEWVDGVLYMVVAGFLETLQHLKVCWAKVLMVAQQRQVGQFLGS